LKTRLKKTRQNKKIERGHDSVQSDRALIHPETKHSLSSTWMHESYLRALTGVAAERLIPSISSKLNERPRNTLR
jgi:hypothetical protein